tara:strand:+ start:268 stop:768 length:501 start_codon:yes stop_codon:yes gene_type:complete
MDTSRYTRYTKKDDLKDAPLVCGHSIGKTDRVCQAKPTFRIHEDNQWCCGRHLAKALEEDCSICMCKMKAKQRDILPCGHTFHESCLTKWEKASKNTTCPLCRTAYAYDEETSDEEETQLFSDEEIMVFSREHESVRLTTEDFRFDLQHIWLVDNQSHVFIDLTVD